MFSYNEIISKKIYHPLTICYTFSDERIPSGLVVMTLAFRMEVRGFESAARRMLLSQTGFETMNPALPAKAVGPQPANVPLRNEV